MKDRFEDKVVIVTGAASGIGEAIRASGAKRAWVYFNNDNDAHAPRNALTLRRLLRRVLPAMPAIGTLPIREAFSDVRETFS